MQLTCPTFDLVLAAVKRSRPLGNRARLREEVRIAIALLVAFLLRAGIGVVALVLM